MKSEHRHELAENDLSKLLSKWGAEFDKHANTILTALIVLALIAAGIIYWTRTTAATSALGWTDLANAGSADDFVSVAEAYAGTPVAPWATLRAGDGFLREGIRLSLSDRPMSNERLTQAKESYEALLKNRSLPKEIGEQAQMGYAVTLETLSNGDTDEAVAEYKKLLADFPETRFKKFAEDRITELDTTNAKEFYAWFSRINPRPADMPGPQDSPLDAPQLPGASDLTNLLKETGGTGIPESAPFTVPDSGVDDATDANPFDTDDAKAMPDESTETTTDEPTTETAPEASKEEPKPETTPAESKPDDQPKQPAAEEAESATEQKQPAESAETKDESPAESESESGDTKSDDTKSSDAKSDDTDASASE